MASAGEAEFEHLLRRVDAAVEALEPDELARRRGLRGHHQRRRQERRRPDNPWQRAARDAHRAAMDLLDRARQGSFTHLSLERKRRLLNRFVRLLTDAGVSVGKRSGLQGTFDELLRTPARARAHGQAQKTYVAGGVALPGQSRRGTTRIDHPTTRQRIVNLKGAQLHRMTAAQALQRARADRTQAVRNARQLPDGWTIVLSYANSPSPEIQQAMVDILLRPPTPISQVRFGSAVLPRGPGGVGRRNARRAPGGAPRGW
jgi:hypothetical protein